MAHSTSQIQVVSDGLSVLLPVVATWFRETYGEPTPPQQRGWPAIASGANTLIFAPTGSGKTLAAFLACLDHLWRTPGNPRSVRVLYVSPLKALNQDISKNLEGPLQGIIATAERLGVDLRPLSVGVRSGDTSTSERQKMVRKPPDILITTPESLHLLLTSRARETLRSVSHVIVDEIHALCPNKRGVFLSLLLERLESLNPAGFTRIGLSATQRPLEEVARYLGGSMRVVDQDGNARYEPRAVAIIDTGQRKTLDLEVTAAFGSPADYARGSVWPAIEAKLHDLIREHRSTIVFANNRRVVERLTAHLNERDALFRFGSDDCAESVADLARSHHGSLSLSERQATEASLKLGELAAVIATASLELGIDMGAVDLVCQVESPGNVSRGLQRVGRAGHLVGRVSKGRLIAKTAGDLLESAALCHKMARGEVEALRVPTNCLDVLAQQLVAIVAMEPWDATALFDLVRQAYPYRELSASAFEAVLKMVSGRFPLDSFRDLNAKISWDRVHNKLSSLPGSARLAIVNGGTIPDTGQYPVYLGDGGPRLGELDEEFVLERRVGETFVLGTATWRITAIEPLRVVVAAAEGRSSLMPFWRGEDSPRTAELGEAVGALSREISEHRDDPALESRLRIDYRLDAHAARLLRDYVTRQIQVAGTVPDDRTVLVESFQDPSGELGLAILSTFGGKLHQGLKIILQARLKERLGISAACLHSDDGMLFRLPGSDELPLDIFRGLTADIAEAMLREEVGDSALFGLRFRQNAGRALLMPRPDPSKRTPLWLQRLRARDLLEVVRKFPDFPIVVETYRECLHDDLDIPRLRAFFEGIASGSIRVETRRAESPSPFVSNLIFRFEHHFLYQWDEPKKDRSTGKSPVDDALLDALIDPTSGALWLDANAIGQVEGRLRSQGHPPRTLEEMAEALRRLGDLTPDELSGPMLAFLEDLKREGRAETIKLDVAADPLRWISAEESALYGEAFPEGRTDAPNDAMVQIVRRHLQSHALVGLDQLTRRYPMSPALATELLERWADEGIAIRLEPLDDEDARWADPRNLGEVRRLSVALRRRESVAVAPEVYADFLIRHQGVHPSTRREGSHALVEVMEMLKGVSAPADLWESEILPARIVDYRPAWLDELLACGNLYWRAGAESRGATDVAFLDAELPVIRGEIAEPLADDARAILAVLESKGASFATDLARFSGMEPSRLRNALGVLSCLGTITNDRLDPLRAGADAMTAALSGAAAAARVSSRRPRIGRGLSRAAKARPEGRWSRISESSGDRDAVCSAWAGALLARYGVLSRETAALDPLAPSWKDLAMVLSRAEILGEVRRGFFVEGLSGVQYATAEAAEALAARAGDRSADTESILISTLDPANLYGSGAPFDINLLEGGTARLTRSNASYLVLRGGRPVLIIEGHGKRLTGLNSASEAELRSAIALLPSLAKAPRRVLKVETYNTAATLASPAEPWLADAGFVRDYPGMAYYARW